MADLGNWGQYGLLDESKPYGKHIRLKCKNHPDLRWFTKNIAPIGARNIFFDGHCKYGSIDPNTNIRIKECSCSGSNLILADESS